MITLLAVNSSPGINWSVTRRLLNDFVGDFVASVPDVRVIERDVGRDPPPHLSDALINAYFTPPELHTDAQKQEIACSDGLTDEFLTADIVVIGSPMHNFGITSGLKAYIDHIVRAGRTFAFSAQGPVGLVRNHKVIFLTARGSDYSPGSPLFNLDHQESHMRSVFNFMGVTDVSFLHCQGTRLGDDVRDRAIADALARIHSTVESIAHPPASDDQQQKLA